MGNDRTGAIDVWTASFGVKRRGNDNSFYCLQLSPFSCFLVCVLCCLLSVSRWVTHGCRYSLITPSGGLPSPRYRRGSQVNDFTHDTWIMTAFCFRRALRLELRSEALTLAMAIRVARGHSVGKAGT